MNKKNAWFIIVLILSLGAITLGGCSKDIIDNEDEENLGASRPNYNMLGDLSRPGASISWTLWESHTQLNYSMKIEFNHTECTYTHKRDGLADETIKFSYSFKYPTITLTSNDENKEVIVGTIVSDNFRADEITFRNAKNETVWMKMTRKK